MAPNRKGFTLIELATAAAIFGILGAMLFSIVRSGMDMWTRGEAQRDEVEKGTVVLDALAGELRMVFCENTPLAGGADVRFLCDFVDLDCDGDGQRETRVQRLFFVRINMEERENLEMRTAGDLPQGDKYFTLTGPGAGSGERKDEGRDGSQAYQPTGGLAEAAFMACPGPPELAPGSSKKRKMSGLFNLYRGYRSPIGGEDSYFARGALHTHKDILRSLVPIADGLLHLEFRFSDQETDGLFFDKIEAGSEGSAGFSWDSTRAVLPFDPAEGPSSFRFAVGPSSLSDPSDDIVPSRVLIEVVVAAGNKENGIARLAEKVEKGATRIPVDAVRPFKEWRFGERLVRIEGEWIRFSRIEGSSLIVSERGARHTLPHSHKAGTPVFAGRAFSTEVALPVARECWNE